MKRRLICLFLCILMLVPVCLMAGCADKTDEEVTSDMEEEASEATVTVAMYLLSDQHVCTAEELAKIKDESGATSAAYIEAKAVYDSHKKVEAEMNKITKAKFKTQVNVYWYTEDEYYDVIEKKMADYELEVELRDKAKLEFEKFEREQQALGNVNRLEIKALFDEKFPEYAEYITIVADPDETSAETAEETIKTESGMIELKYPDEKKNQIDIIYIGGYELYKKYANNNWLNGLNEEFANNSKALNAYINAAFFDAMQMTIKDLDGNDLTDAFAVPGNNTIGEYVYMLVDKQLYSEYYYPIDEIDNITSIADIYEFIEDIGKSSLNIVPFTGELITTGTHFWSVDYTFKPAENLLQFEDGKSYFTKNSDGTYALVGDYVEGIEYFTLSSDTGHYVALKEEGLKSDETYYIVDPSAYIKADKFVSGVTYYTVDTKGNYVVADGITEFESGVQYYKISSKNYVKVDTSSYDAAEGVNYYTRVNGEYIKAEGLTSFASGTTYYVVRDAGDPEDPEVKAMYVEYGAFDPAVEYYVADITFKGDDFSVIGSNVAADADNKAELDFESIFSENMDYADQLLAIKKIKENGFYDADALTNSEKTFATAIVKGGSDLVEKYGDKYAMVMLDAPTADFSKMYDNLFAVPVASANLARAMEVVTLLNTDSEFRNLVQYGIEEENYTVKTVEIDGKKYPQIERLNKYYMMDIYKTGNLFIAYPEEGMPANIWEYAKLQNRDSRLDVLSSFKINTLTTPDLELLDAVKAISKEYKEQLDACETAEELEALIEELAIKAEMDETLKRLIDPAEEDTRSLGYIYKKWYESVNAEK